MGRVGNREEVRSDRHRPDRLGVSRAKNWVIAGVVVLAGAGFMAATRYGWGPFGAAAQAPQAKAPPRTIPVEVATAVKKTTPVQLEALGTVTPMASVAVKPRIDSEIVAIHFADGARVNQGDVLITLD